jgi:hypothetical protein
VWGNLLAYAGWTADRLATYPPGEAPATWFCLAGLAALAVLPVLDRGPAVRAGLALWLLALLPVLPLSHHTYVHYLYLPLAGACVAAAAVFASRVPWGRDPRVPWAVALVLALGCAVAADRSMTGARDTMLPQLHVPRDSFVRKMEIARHAAADLGATLPSDATRLLVLSPAETRQAYSVTTGRAVTAMDAGTPRYDMIAATLDDGRGLRALFPQLRDARFAERLAPGDSDAVLATNYVDGHMAVAGRGPQGVSAVADLWARKGLVSSAGGLLREGAAIWPADAGIAARLRAIEEGNPAPGR